MRVLVTGATGFIGRAVAGSCAADPGLEVCGTVRRHSPNAGPPAGIKAVPVDDLSDTTPWREAVQGVDTIVHAAARVHDMREKAADPLAEFRRVNVVGTLNLARQAVAAGFRRFIFVSSIKVNGEETFPGRPYTSADVPAPTDPYGISKHEAEAGLRELGEKTGLEVVIIRPVLVYGPGVRGNFLSILRVLHRGLPLPLGALSHNRRSLVALDNLVDLIVTCLRHSASANQTFLVSDGEDLSTTAFDHGVAAPHRGGTWAVGPPAARAGVCLADRGPPARPGGLCATTLRLPAGGHHPNPGAVGMGPAGQHG
jgi:nucleoside-diphosphate-sugar epimerase